MSILVRGVAKCMCIEEDLEGYFKIDRSWLDPVRQYMTFDPKTNQLDYTLNVTARNDSQYVTLVYNVDRPDKPGSPSRMRLAEVLQNVIDPNKPPVSSNHMQAELTAFDLESPPTPSDDLEPQRKPEMRPRNWANVDSSPEPPPAKKRKMTPEGTHEDPISLSSDSEVEQDDEEDEKDKRVEDEGKEHDNNKDAQSEPGLEPDPPPQSRERGRFLAKTMETTVEGGASGTQPRRNLSKPRFINARLPSSFEDPLPRATSAKDSRPVKLSVPAPTTISATSITPLASISASMRPYGGNTSVSRCETSTKKTSRPNAASLPFTPKVKQSEIPKTNSLIAEVSTAQIATSATSKCPTHPTTSISAKTSTAMLVRPGIVSTTAPHGQMAHADAAIEKQTQAIESTVHLPQAKQVDGAAPASHSTTLIDQPVLEVISRPLLPIDRLPQAAPPIFPAQPNPSQTNDSHDPTAPRPATPSSPSDLPRDINIASTTSRVPLPWQEVPGTSIPSIYSADLNSPQTVAATATTSTPVHPSPTLMARRESAAGAGRLFKKAMRNTASPLQSAADRPVSESTPRLPPSAPIPAIPRRLSSNHQNPVKRKKPFPAKDSAIDTATSTMHCSLPAKLAQTNLGLHGSREQRLTSQTMASSMRSQTYMPSGATRVTVPVPVTPLPKADPGGLAACDPASLLSSAGKEASAATPSETGLETSETGRSAEKEDSTCHSRPSI